MVKRYSRDDVLNFLREDPARPAMLATVRRDGRPHVAPVWYDVDDDGTVVFNTGADTVKGRNLRRTGRAALSVQDDRPPYSFVTVEGPVEVSEDLEEVRRWAARLGGRYLGADRAEEMGERNGVPGELLLRLTVEQATGMGDLSD
jgi:PPOX class probable F420-dependent enzyme